MKQRFLAIALVPILMAVAFCEELRRQRQRQALGELYEGEES